MSQKKSKEPTKQTIKPKGNFGKSASAPLSSTFYAAIFLAIVAFLIYSNTLKNGYALDDNSVTQGNSIVSKGISQIPTILSTPYRHGYWIVSNDFYRPLSLVMFAIEYQISGGSPALMHLVNVLLFVGCVMLMFYFFDQLFDRKKTVVAFIAALLFALHPIHTEVVANIKSRDELLCFLFLFLSLNLFLRYQRSEKIGALTGGICCFFLSLISKETSITFLFIIPFIFFVLRNENRKAGVFITAGSFVAGFAFLAIRFAVLRANAGKNVDEVLFIDNFLIGAPSLSVKIGTAILILGYYLKLLFVPYPLSCSYSFYSIPFAGFSNVYVILTILAYLSLIVFCIYRIIKDRKDPYAFGILFFLVTISLFSNIILTLGAAMAERFVFLSSAGFCLIIALLIDQWVLRSGGSDLAMLKSRKALMLLVPICIVYSGLTISRNTVWESDTTLFKNDATKSPEDSRLSYYWGTELMRQAKAENDPLKKSEALTESLKYLHQSLADYPKYNDALTNLGVVYSMTGQNDSAELYSKIAIEQNPLNAMAMENEATLCFTKQDFKAALYYERRAHGLKPDYVDDITNMAMCYNGLGQYDSSLLVLRQALKLQPGFKPAYINLGQTYRAMGQIDSANYYDALSK